MRHEVLKIIIPGFLIALAGCTGGGKLMNSPVNSLNASSVGSNPGSTSLPSPVSPGPAPAVNPTPTPAGPPIVAGNGMNFAGTGALSVPTANAVVARLQNATGLSAVTSKNFKAALAATTTNLPKVTDPTVATGFDQVQLLVYGACADLTANMQTKYNVVANNSISSNQTALVAAGMTMLDAYAAGLVSQSSAATSVQTAFTNLVTTLSATSTNTSTIAFVSVCIAANTTGAALLGF